MTAASQDFITHRTMATSIASPARRDRRRGQFWLRKKLRGFCTLMIVVFPVCCGVLFGLAVSWPYWLASIPITALFVFYLVAVHWDEVRDSRCVSVSKHLQPGQSLWVARLTRRLRRRRALIVFVCILGVCWLLQKVAGGPRADLSCLLILGFFIAQFWKLFHDAADANEPKEVAPPSEEVLALASYPMTKVNAIKMYRKESKLGLKEAKKAIEDALRSSRDVERAY
jgi:hypothetical protein